MARNFKLNGNTEGKFKQIEMILPRVMSHMSTKTYGIIPASILQAYTKEPDSEGMLVSGCVFKGQVKKVAFRIKDIIGKETPEYACVFYRGDETSSFAFRTKKKNYVQEIDVEVNDGDYFEIFQVNHAEVQVSKVNIAILMKLHQKDCEVHEVMTDQLLESLKDEGI